MTCLKYYILTPDNFHKYKALIFAIKHILITSSVFSKKQIQKISIYLTAVVAKKLTLFIKKITLKSVHFEKRRKLIIIVTKIYTFLSLLNKNNQKGNIEDNKLAYLNYNSRKRNY